MVLEKFNLEMTGNQCVQKGKHDGALRARDWLFRKLFTSPNERWHEINIIIIIIL